MMVIRSLIALVLVGICALESQACGSQFTGRMRQVRGGASYSMFRRSMQMQQQYQKQLLQEQARLEAQEKAEAEAAEKRRHEKLEAAAAANREIKQKERERGERARHRAVESTASSKSRGEKTAASPATSAPPEGAKDGAKREANAARTSTAADRDLPKK